MGKLGYYGETGIQKEKRDYRQERKYNQKILRLILMKETIYRYSLVSASFGEVVLESAPKGWENSGFKYSRSQKYWGMFRSRSDEVLSFPQEGKAFLKKIYDIEGSEGKCEFV